MRRIVVVSVLLAVLGCRAQDFTWDEDNRCYVLYEVLGERSCCDWRPDPKTGLLGNYAGSRGCFRTECASRSPQGECTFWIKVAVAPAQPVPAQPVPPPLTTQERQVRGWTVGMVLVVILIALGPAWFLSAAAIAGFSAILSRREPDPDARAPHLRRLRWALKQLTRQGEKRAPEQRPLYLWASGTAAEANGAKRGEPGVPPPTAGALARFARWAGQRCGAALRRMRSLR